jgi:hypothetical protein
MFIQQAEQKIYNTVQIPALRKNVSATTTSSNRYLALPGDFLYAYSMAIYTTAGNVYSFLLYKDVNFMREAYPNPTTTGTPKHYSQWSDGFFILGPTPDAAYNVELYYGHYPTSIVTATNTFLGDDFDSALLNGALIEAVRFQKQEPDVIQNYEKLYLQSITLLKNAYEGRNVTDNYRSGTYKVEVS